MLNSISAIAIRALFWLIRLIPVRIIGALGATLGRLAFYIAGKHKKIALTNLKRIYPERSHQWHQQTAKASFAELGRTSFELPHVFLRSKAFLLSRVSIENEHLLKQAQCNPNGAFLAACHHSNWELGGLMISLLGYQSSIIYRPIKMPAVDNFLRQCRARFGADLQSRWEGLRWLPRALKKHQFIAVMTDQHISQGIQVPFLGHIANTTTLPATFIARQQSSIIGVSLQRHSAAFRFTLKFHEIPLPKVSGDKDADIYHITKAICASFAPIIHQRPELWLWLHRRWFILEQDQELAEVIYAQA